MKPAFSRALTCAGDSSLHTVSRPVWVRAFPPRSHLPWSGDAARSTLADLAAPPAPRREGLAMTGPTELRLPADDPSEVQASWCRAQGGGR